MKHSRLLRRVAATAVSLFFFFAAGLPTVSAADTTYNIEDDDLVIGTSGSYSVTGTTSSNHITISNGVTSTITLHAASISSSTSPAIELQSGATVTLLLDGISTLTSTSTGSAGIYVPLGATLTINKASSAGAVTVQSGEDAAGIGGRDSNVGTVNISGGTVTANGGTDGAGIGGGRGSGNGGSIIISGGTITAHGGTGGAGIGGGGGFGNGGSIIISGGTITANGGTDGAGIGGGFFGNGGSIAISGGTITAHGGINGAGIGGGLNGDGGSVTISGIGTTVTARSENSRDIGAGADASGGTLSVGDGAHLTLQTGMDNSIDPTNVTLGNCTVVDGGMGNYNRTYIPPVVPPAAVTAANSVKIESSAPVFLPSSNGSGVEIDVSALALPAGVTLISKDFTGLPTSAAGKTWTLSLRFAGTNGTFHGRAYLALYELLLTDENGKPVTGYIGRVTVRLPLPSGSSGGLHVLYYDESGSQFTEMLAVPDDKFLTYSTTHFSSYLVTGKSVGEKPAIPETGAPVFPIAAAGVILLLTLAALLMARNKIKN